METHLEALSRLLARYRVGSVCSIYFALGEKKYRSVAPGQGALAGRHVPAGALSHLGFRIAKLESGGLHILAASDKLKYPG